MQLACFGVLPTMLTIMEVLCITCCCYQLTLRVHKLMLSMVVHHCSRGHVARVQLGA
jgi:hypothetical protein